MRAGKGPPPQESGDRGKGLDPGSPRGPVPGTRAGSSGVQRGVAVLAEACHAGLGTEASSPHRAWNGGRALLGDLSVMASGAPTARGRQAAERGSRLQHSEASVSTRTKPGLAGGRGCSRLSLLGTASSGPLQQTDPRPGSQSTVHRAWVLGAAAPHGGPRWPWARSGSCCSRQQLVAGLNVLQGSTVGSAHHRHKVLSKQTALALRPHPSLNTP